jgi:hypothetical protein
VVLYLLVLFLYYNLKFYLIHLAAKELNKKIEEKIKKKGEKKASMLR